MKEYIKNNYESLILLTPGPVNIPRRSLEAGARFSFHHRTEEFKKELAFVTNTMKLLFNTEEDVLVVHTTGRGAMEATITNLFSKDEEILSICNGSFGKMYADIAARNGLKVTRLFENWEQEVDLAQLEKAIIENPNVAAITVVHGDTSNGITNPIKEISKLTEKYNILLMVDAVSTLGCMEFNFDTWKVDTVVTASQKGLMSPPGISFVVLSEKARKKAETNKSNDFYINFADIKDKQNTIHETPGTTPVSIVLSCSESLRIILEEGIENVYARHKQLSLRLKRAIQSLRIELFQNTEITGSHALTVGYMPQGIDSSELVTFTRRNFGILIAKGLGPYASSTFRIAHMGNSSLRDICIAIIALEAFLLEKGIINNLGKSLEVFLKEVE